MKICDDHTSGGSLGFPTPAAQNADNDLAVGRLVDLVSHSIYWKDSAIVMVEDDPQNGVDHVDGHRSTAFIISPYTKRGAVIHTYYTQVNLLRTIEDILGLSPMNQHDQLVPPMADAFTNDADVSAYAVIPNNMPLDAMNVSAKNKLEKAWQKEVAKYFPQGSNQQADLADPNLLNHAIWYTNTHFSKPFPGENAFCTLVRCKRLLARKTIDKQNGGVSLGLLCGRVPPQTFTSCLRRIFAQSYIGRNGVRGTYAWRLPTFLVGSSRWGGFRSATLINPATCM